MTKRKLAGWWKLVFALILALGVLNLITYSMGGSGVRTKGSKPSIDREADYQYFKINDKYAFSYSPKYQSTDFVTYKKANGLNALFGDFVKDENLFLQPSRNGDWVYNSTPGFTDQGKTIAVNINTDEKIAKAEPKSEDIKFFPNNLQAKGLSQDTSKEIKEADLLKLEPLNMPKESAITLFLGILAALVFWLLILPFAYRKVNQNQ